MHCTFNTTLLWYVSPSYTIYSGNWLHNSCCRQLSHWNLRHSYMNGVICVSLLPHQRHDKAWCTELRCGKRPYARAIPRSVDSIYGYTHRSGKMSVNHIVYILVYIEQGSAKQGKCRTIFLFLWHCIFLGLTQAVKYVKLYITKLRLT